MYPVLFKIGPFTVYSYGTMVAIGFALAVFFTYSRARLFSLDKNKMMDLCVLMLISGVAGARILYILLNFSYYVSTPAEILNLSKGGLVWYGGFFAVLFSAIVYVKKMKLDFWAVADLFAPYFALAQGFGRIGCFLNGCCYGKEVSPGSLFAVTRCGETVSRLPVQLYAALSLFLIFGILRIWQDRRKFPGEIFLGYCILYSCKRFGIEFLRADNPKILFSLTMSQIISIAVLGVSLGFFIYKAKAWKKRTLNSK